MAYIYCATCGKKTYSERSSAKYCDQSCKNRYHAQGYADTGHNDMSSIVKSVTAQLRWLHEQYLTGEYNPDMQIDLVSDIDALNYQINKIDAYLMTVQSEADVTWYECLNCGQKTFGRVDSCDFCEHTEFKRIANMK